jgi:hypothetical protein
MKPFVFPSLSFQLTHITKMHSVMQRSLLFVVLVLVAGCGIQVRTPVHAPPAAPLYLTVQSLTLNDTAHLNPMEEGVAVFIRVTSIDNPAVGGHANYPANENVVLMMGAGDSHHFIPTTSVPVRADINTPPNSGRMHGMN